MRSPRPPRRGQWRARWASPAGQAWPKAVPPSLPPAGARPKQVLGPGFPFLQGCRHNLEMGTKCSVSSRGREGGSREDASLAGGLVVFLGGAGSGFRSSGSRTGSVGVNPGSTRTGGGRVLEWLSSPSQAGVAVQGSNPGKGEGPHRGSVPD